MAVSLRAQARHRARPGTRSSRARPVPGRRRRGRTGRPSRFPPCSVSDRRTGASQADRRRSRPMSKLQNKVAIVTGASKGIGASIARYLASEGAAVVVNYASSTKDADRVVADIARGGGRAVAVQGNVARQADVDRLFAETKQAFGRLDILVNNAGVYEFAALDDVTEENVRKLFDVNVLGVLLASQAAARDFDATGGSI